MSITQAICDHRSSKGIDGPLFLGIDTHALSKPAFDSALEVLATNRVQTMIAASDEFTPTPVISHAILVHNRGRAGGLADGIVITPSHHPPDFGGFKYKPRNGGPAGTGITGWVQNRANALLKDGLKDVKRLPLARARKAPTTQVHDYGNAHVADHVANKKADVVRIYLAPDANCLLSIADHCLRSRNYVNLIIAGKQPAPQWLDIDAAVRHCAATESSVLASGGR